MNNKIIDLLKEKNYIIPGYILKDISKFNISLNSLLILIYLLNQKEPILNDYNVISSIINMNKKEIMMSIEELKNKKIITIKVEENKEKRLEENIYLDVLYNNFFMNIINEEDKDEPNEIFQQFEKQFGRTLSPIEYELINGWQELGYTKDIILEALRESILNGVTNLKYIDKILIEWDKKGIKNKEQINKDRENYSKKKNVDIPEFDWVNDEENI